MDAMEAVGGESLGLILKIETRQGFQQLPGILLAAMEWPLVGVMIARGDLAIEVGWTPPGSSTGGDSAPYARPPTFRSCGPRRYWKDSPRKDSRPYPRSAMWPWPSARSA